MIESNVIEFLDFGDIIQKISPYSKTYLELYFRYFRILIKNKSFPIIIDILLIIISFIQLLTISSVFLSSDNDIIIEIFKYLKNILLVLELKNNEKIFFKLFIFISIVIIIDIILMFIILFTMKIIILKSFINIVILLNNIIFYYLIGPAIEICLIFSLCNNENQVLCFNYLNYINIQNLIFSILVGLLYIFISIIFSIYNKEIGSIITDINVKTTRVHCNYEIFYLLSKIIIFAIHFFLNTKNNNFIFLLIYEGIIFIICIIMSIYVYRNVYYYNDIINIIIYYGWYYCSWFSIWAFMKILFNLKNITIFVVIGWSIIIFLFNKNFTIKEFLLIADSNILELKNIKSIEIFSNNILKLLADKDNIKSKILLYGIIKNLDNYFNNNPELNYHYQKLLKDKYLRKKFNKKDELPILSIIYLIYNLQLEKSNEKEEITLHMCYFLINKFHNPTYAILLCSKMKTTKHINLYYKYILTEDIKEYLIYKLKKNSNNESIKNVQIGSSILYYLYIDLFKIKIYDAICNQIDYFEIIKDHIINDKITNKLIKIGDSILKLRKEIIEIWEKIIELNPFSDEPYNDYSLYLDTIIQDEMLAKEEYQKYIKLKNEKTVERYNIYNNMFFFGKSSVILFDGYLTYGKILYASPTIDILSSYNEKEILNINIEDLLPNIIRPFHKELIENAIKYSNINNIFNEQKNILLKKKNGGLINLKLFVKPVPNLCYGLIYFAYLYKISDSNCIIVLDKELNISGFTEATMDGSSFTRNKYNLNYGLCGQHIGLIIPDILTLLDYKNGEFNIIKCDCKLKGYLYSVNKILKIKPKVEFILNKRKNSQNDNEIQIEDAFKNIVYEYNDLINELSKEKVKSFRIYYNIQLHSFLDGKYKYYRIYVNDDIILGKEDIHEINDIESLNLKDSSYLLSSKETKKEIEKTSKKIINRKRKSTEKKNSVKNFPVIKSKNIENTVNNRKESKNFFDKIFNIKKKEPEQNKDKSEKEEKNNQNNIQNNNQNNNQININLKSQLTFLTTNKDNKFKNLKMNIINKKNIYQIKIMFILCFIFGIISIFFLIFHEFIIENSFQKLSTFLDENIFFNMTKMSVAILYITSINIKWQLHLYKFQTIYNITLLNEQILIENIEYLRWISNFTNNLGEEFDEIVHKIYDIKLNIFEEKEVEIYKVNNYNLLSYFANRGINLLKIYPYLLKYFITKEQINLYPIVMESEMNELNNLANYTYLYYNSNIDGFKEEEKNKIINIIFFNYPLGLIFSGIIIFFILIIFIYYILRIHRLEDNFINRLIYFNSVNLDFYKKQLDELKKKLTNDNGEEEEKDDIFILDSDSKTHSKEEEIKSKKKERTLNNLFIKIKIDIKRYRNKKKKIKKIKRFFFKNNCFFGIKLLLTFIIYLSYYILSILIEKVKKNEFVNFDSINDSIIGVFKESYDIFIPFKRQLELYENYLENSKNINNIEEIYKIELPSISKIKAPNLGNAIMEISTGLGHKSESLTNLTEIFTGDACKLLTNDIEEYYICSNYFWNGILAKGIEQTFVKMGDVFKTIVEELESINNGGKNFTDILKSSTYSLYELFTEIYYQRAYRRIDEFFWKIRNEKLYSILKIIRRILTFYIIITFFLFISLTYFVYTFKNLFNSFLNFIGILPSKYLAEDENFYKDIIRFGDEYY